MRRHRITPGPQAPLAEHRTAASIAIAGSWRAYAAFMRPRTRLRLLGGGSALLALSGLWIGHTLEYVRVWGTQGLLTELFGSVHMYMLPMAAVLGGLAALCSYHAYRLWLRLGRRLDGARTSLRAALTGDEAPRRRPVHRLPSAPARILLAWPVLTAAQVGLYLVQENIEAIRAGLVAPGFGAVTGVHALAPLVHALVALALLLLVAAARALLRRRVAELHRVEAALQRILARLRRDATPRTGRIPSAPPLQLVASHRWRRPPPVLTAA
jgi:hypothetical protein